VLREEANKGNNFDLNKIISIFDSPETYTAIQERYPELTDDLLHLMPEEYSKVQLGQLVSAIWSKYLSLQGGDVETQRQLLEKEREIFQKDKEVETLKLSLDELKKVNPKLSEEEYENYLASRTLDSFIRNKGKVLTSGTFDPGSVAGSAEAKAFGLLFSDGGWVKLSDKGHRFFEWLILKRDTTQ